MERKRFEVILVYTGILFPVVLALPILDKPYLFLTLSLSALTLIFQLKEKQVPNLITTLLAILIILVFLVTVNLGNFLPLSLTVLIVLLFIKLLEKRTLRNLFQVYLLALLILAGLTYFYIHFSFFILLLLNLVYLPVALFLHLYLEEGKLNRIEISELKSAVASILLLLGITILLAVVFFLTFPRLSHPLFQIALPGKKAKTGFTDTIRLGAVSEIQESSARVLRLELSSYLPPADIYLRVITYDYFDGRTWKKKTPQIPRSAIPHSKRPLISGIIYLEIPQGEFLPVVDSPFNLRVRFPLDVLPDYTYRLGSEATYPLKYTFISSLIREKQALEGDLSPYLQLPHLSLEIKSLAKNLRGETEEETIQKIYQYLRQPSFSYSLRGMLTTTKPLDDFLFKTKRGNCEYFAGAMAVLLRLNGIPARIVGGYHGAIYQTIGNYYIVEERFAHAWVEAYLKGKWITLDPTPPGRVQEQNKLSTLKRITLILDLINYHYLKLIGEYDLSKQKKLFNFFKQILQTQTLEKLPKIKCQGSLSKYSLLPLLIILLALVVLFILKILFTILLKPKEKRLLERFLKVLAKAGYKRQPSMGLEEFTEGIKETPLKRIAQEFVSSFASCYYKDKDFSKEDLERLRAILKKLKEQLKQRGDSS